MRSPVLLLAFALFSGCVSKPRQAAPSAPAMQPPRPAMVVPAPPSVDWIDRPATPGDWSYGREATGSVARFSLPGQSPLFSIRCISSERAVLVSRAGAFPPQDSGVMTLRGTTGAKTFTVSNLTETPTYVGARLSPTDPQLDAVAFSRGRFLVQVKGGEDLVLPAWPEVGRVIEDCRAG